ncbi:MAG: HAMP domain-containing protein [Hymenobacter sp.]
MRDIANVATAVARGDLSQKITVNVRGELLDLKENPEPDGGLAERVRRRSDARGPARWAPRAKLGGQANVPGVKGTWKDLTDNVNTMAASLTSQVRDIANVTTAVARGDLVAKVSVDVGGESARPQGQHQPDGLAQHLRRRGNPRGGGSEVPKAARRPGQRAQRSGAWKDLTDNVNTMAANLTTQVRGIVKIVAEAVSQGDLTQESRCWKPRRRSRRPGPDH